MTETIEMLSLGLSGRWSCDTKQAQNPQRAQPPRVQSTSPFVIVGASCTCHSVVVSAYCICHTAIVQRALAAQGQEPALLILESDVGLKALSTLGGWPDSCYKGLRRGNSTQRLLVHSGAVRAAMGMCIWQPQLRGTSESTEFAFSRSVREVVKKGK